MKQRLKLGLGLYSQNPVLLLDEPTSNLDEKAKNWFFKLLQTIKNVKLIIIASNQPEEFGICDEKINISDFKQSIH
jgi:ABC-type multidrug transport system ATPase subunit